MQWWPKARYNQIACVLIFGPMLLSPLFIFFMDETHSKSTESLLFSTLVGLNIIAVIGIGYALWVCPYCSSGDDQFEFKLSPRLTLRRFQLNLWLLTAILAFVSILLAVGNIVIEAVSDPPWGSSQKQWRWAALVPLLMLAFIPTLLISRKLRPRMIAVTRRRLICFPCGYDLHGNPDAKTCPECGVAVPWIKQEETIAGDPGQGLAGHDRA